MMRKGPCFILAAMLASCSGDGGKSDDYTRVPVKVAGVTYAYPTNSNDVAGMLKEANGRFALFPKRLWNRTIGEVTSFRFPQDEGDVTVYLTPAKKKHWNIQPDGEGLPRGIRFSNIISDGNAFVGEDNRPENVNVPKIVVFKGETEAYASCIFPDKPHPFCYLSMNDRGVEHTLPVQWGKWSEVPLILRLYRGAIGAPEPK